MTAKSLVVLFCFTLSFGASAQAWKDCVPGSIGPGGCDSIGPGGGKSIGPGGGQSDQAVEDQLGREEGNLSARAGGSR